MESHQAGKLDTSGTAKDVISCFQKLGVSFDMDQVCGSHIFLIERERERERSSSFFYWLEAGRGGRRRLGDIALKSDI